MRERLGKGLGAMPLSCGPPAGNRLFERLPKRLKAFFRVGVERSGAAAGDNQNGVQPVQLGVAVPVPRLVLSRKVDSNSTQSPQFCHQALSEVSHTDAIRHLFQGDFLP